MSSIDPTAHDAPLQELVARLGGGRSLRERVIALRYRRKRPSVGQAGATGDQCSVADEGRQPDPLSGDAGRGNDAAANGGNVNNESEVGGE